MIGGIGFAQPVALYGLLALAVPLVIHILSKSKGKLQVFSAMQFLRHVEPVKLKQIFLQEPLLLFLRMIMIFLSVMILAKFFLNDDISLSNSKNKVLVSELWLNTSNAEERKALVSQGEREFYLLKRGFPKLSSENITKWPVILPENAVLTESINSWLLVKEFLSLNHHEIVLLNEPKANNEHQAVTVYTTDRVAEFSGSKAMMDYSVDWRVLNTADRFLSPKEYFNQYSLSRNGLTKRVIILDDESGTAEKLQFALAMINQLSPLKVKSHLLSIAKLRSNNDENILRTDQDLKNVWLLYLPNKKLFNDDQTLPSEGEWVLSKVKAGANLVTLRSNVLTFSQGGNQASLIKTITPTSEQLFQFTPFEFGNIYFVKPKGSWQKLTQQKAFVQWLYALLIGQEQKTFAHHYSRLTAEQIAPLVSERNSHIFERQYKYPSQAFPPILLMLLLVLFVERLLSEWVAYQKVFTNKDRVRDSHQDKENI